MADKFVVAGTGHRPPRLKLGYDSESRHLLREFAREQLRSIEPTEVVSGMAQGWDQALAEAALELNIPFVAAVPFKGQEKKWPTEAQKIFRGILERAVLVQVVCDGSYAPWKFVRRDHWMADRCDGLLALWDGGRSGGTWGTVDYAMKKGKQVVNFWDEWVKHNSRG